MMAPETRFFTFGNFVLDARRRILTRDGYETPISAKNFDLLFALVQSDGRVLTHDELLDAVWGETFVEQSNLKKGISAIRQILGETPGSSQYIKTVPRKGYSFVAPVAVTQDELTERVTATEIIIEDEVIEDDAPAPQRNDRVLRTVENTNWSRYRTYAAGVIAIMFIGLLALYLTGMFHRKGRRFSAETVKITKLTSDGNCNDASISADGNFVLCGFATAEGNGLLTRQVSANSQIQIVPPQRDVSFWAYRITPDGSSVYYILNDKKDAARNGLYRIPFLGGTPVKIASDANGHITFAPDGKKMAFVRIDANSSKIITADMDGGNESQLTEYGFGYRIWGLNWSPDGKTMLCSARRQTGEKFTGFVDEISIMDGSRTIAFPEQEKPIYSAVWTPDKTSILLGIRETNSEVRQVWQYFPFDKELLRVTNDNNIYRFLVLNESGTIISTTQESNLTAIFRGSAASRELRELNSGLRTYESLWLTRDGRLIYNDSEENSEAIWVMNLDGSDRRRITDGKDGSGLQPRLSTDENKIVFASMRTGAKELWSIGIDGAGLTQLTRNDSETIFEGKLLGDNKTLVGYSQNRSENTLWKKVAQGQKEKLVSTSIGKWDVSSDDNLLVYESFNVETKDWEIVVRSMVSDQRINSYRVKTDKVLHWTDAKTIVYTTKDGGKLQVFEQKLDTSPPILLYEYNGQLNENITSFDLDSGDRTFVLIRGRYLVDAVTIKIDDKK